MTTKVQKWGNSFAIRIPKGIVKETRLREGSSISFSIEGDNIILNHSKKPKYTLDELLKNFDKKTQHESFDWGADVGKEILEKW